ncbi:MAG TPA: diguanylate cyclase [Gaiellaceae bacterium]
MSATDFPSDGAATRTHTRRAGSPGLGPAAAAYLVVVVATAAILLTPSHLRSATGADWLLFAVLTACAAPVQLLSVETPAHDSYSPALVFYVAGALLLPPQLVALMIVLAHIPDWLRTRPAWYVETFDIARRICAALAASLVAEVLVGHDDPGQDITRLALGGAIAAAVFVLADDALLAQMLRLARGTRYRESGLFGFANLSTELVLAVLGVGLAAAWELAPALVPFLLAPLVVAYRALRLPSLELAARLDPKTDLFNARYLMTALDAELERARRFGRPLSILLADLDLLREVNNTYGHLAGDAVLRGVAGVLRTQLRPFDIPCRFGGEEFAVILPEAGHQDALAIAERIRRAVEAASFRIPTGEGEIGATVSIGVATHPDADSAHDLVHQADLALYRSKALGRNRVSSQVEGTVSPTGSSPDAAAGPKRAPEPADPGTQGRADSVALGVLVLALVVAVVLLLVRGTVGMLADGASVAYDRIWPLALVAAVLLLPAGFLTYRALARVRASELEARRRAAELEGRRQHAKLVYLKTITALSRAIEGNDAPASVDVVRRLSVELARSLGYRREDLEAIEIGALLHDIGKARVPDRVLNKPGPLTEEEWEAIKGSPLASDQLLSDLEVHPFVRQIARSSHERVDGKGYPDGLAGDEIPLPARIVLVADAFHALASERPYRPARPLSEALEELRAHAGTQFCPTVLAALECLCREQPETFQVAVESAEPSVP